MISDKIKRTVPRIPKCLTDFPAGLLSNTIFYLCIYLTEVFSIIDEFDTLIYHHIEQLIRRP